MLSPVILEKSRNLKQSKLNKNVFIQLHIQYKINGFYDKARIIIEKQKTADGAEALPCLSASYMYFHSSQNHNNVVILAGFFLSLQVEVAKQKKQHENN